MKGLGAAVRAYEPQSELNTLVIQFRTAVRSAQSTGDKTLHQLWLRARTSLSIDWRVCFNST
jgi:hypothetical protein